MNWATASRARRLLALLALGLLLFGGSVRGLALAPLAGALAGDERWLSVADEGPEARLSQPARPGIEQTLPIPPPAESSLALAQTPAPPPETAYAPAPAPPNIAAPRGRLEHDRPSPTGPPDIG